MADDLQQLEHWAGPLLARIEPPARRQLARSIALALRRSQSQRIASQRDPEGNPYTPRRRRAGPLRSKRGAIRRKQAAMFAKLRTARWLKTRVTSEGAEVGFYGRVARLARVHQDGLRDRVARDGVEVTYPQRRLLGFTEADRALVRALLVDQLGMSRSP